MSSMHYILILFLLSTGAAAMVARPNCKHRCGDVSIPFPFGTSEECYLTRSFLITCNNSKAFLGHGNIQVLNISLDGELRILSWEARDCYNKSGNWENSNHPWTYLAMYTLSSSRNKFIAVGCNSRAILSGSLGDKKNTLYATGCLSFCYDEDSVVSGSCSGIGCCQTSVPKGIMNYTISVTNTNYSNFSANDFNPCSHAFVVEDGKYNFSSSNITSDLGFKKVNKFPVILDWAIRNVNCKQAKKNPETYACQGNSSCVNVDEGFGYRCNCFNGFSGNPYLPSGCQDIDECQEDSLNDCISAENCRNTLGSHQCFCPKGYHGDGRKNGSRCQDVDECQDPSLNQCISAENCQNKLGSHACFCPKGYRGDGRKNGSGCISDQHQPLWIKVIIGSSVGTSIFFVIVAFILCGMRKKEINKIKEKNFKENGGLMLQQLLSKIEKSEERAKIFTEDELNKATQNFSASEIVGHGGYGTVYKGILDNKSVAIKKSKMMDRDQIDQFINEVIVLSQIHHPNVVKLIGCCLETPVPLLIYEFITNNTLNHHLHNEANGFSNIPWETRLRIAVETAGALAHMHSDAPIQIVHRDVKPANILLDEQFEAKVSDFGISRLVPFDQSMLSTIVQGTLGYIDPEYFSSGLLNEKSDVYSYGVVLVELLTGEMIISPNRPGKDKSLATFFISAMKDDRLFEILDARVKNEARIEQLKRVAEIAKSCLKSKGKKRPTMKEVKWKLEELMTDTSSNDQAAIYIEETQPLLTPPTDVCSGGLLIVPDTQNFQVAFELESGR